MSYVERDRKTLWHPYTQMKTADPPLVVEKGEGAYLITPEGRRILDGISSWWVCLHGHAHPYLAEALASQARTLEHVLFAGVTHPPAVQLAERLLEKIGCGQSKVFFSDNGSTAVEVALKMAIQSAWNRRDKKRRKIIAFEGAYHGDTFGAMSVSESGAFTRPFSSFLFPVERIPLPREQSENAEHALEALAEKGDVLAWIYEPLIQGAGGMQMYSAQKLERLLEICKHHHILCIADEVMTGFGRTGKPFASQGLNHAPDLICLSKGLTGGTMPMGATTCTDKVFDAFYSEDRSKTFFHGHSYTGNPLACAVGLASLDLLETPTCDAAISRICKQQSELARLLNQSHPWIGARSLGTVFACEFPVERPGYFSEAGLELYRFFLKQDILLRPLGNTLYVLPPYCINAEELDKIHNTIRLALHAAQKP